MITITYSKLIGITIALYLIIYVIILFIKEHLEAKLEDEKDKKYKEELKEKEKELDRRFDNMKEKQEVFWKVYYQRKFEWWKHDYLAKKLDRVSIRLTGNETMTIDYVDIKLQDNFLAIRDRDLNQILINKDFIREVRYYDSGNSRESSEDDKK